MSSFQPWTCCSAMHKRPFDVPQLKFDSVLRSRFLDKGVFENLENWAQEVLVDELVAAVDTLQRYAVSGAVQGVLASLPAALASSAVRSLGAWRPLLLPLPTPLELLDRCLTTAALLCERTHLMYALIHIEYTDGAYGQQCCCPSPLLWSS